MTTSQLAKDYRVLLKHLRRLPSFQAKNSPLRAHVIQQFRQGRRAEGEEEVSQLRAVTHSYATMVSDIKEVKYLRYLDSGEKLEARDKIRNTAARVGLEVPKFADELERELGRNVSLGDLHKQ
eukprot:gene837-912_t